MTIVLLDIRAGLEQLAEVPPNVTIYAPTGRGYGTSGSPNAPATVGQVMAAHQAADKAADAAQAVRDDVEKELLRIRLVIRSILAGHIWRRRFGIGAVLLGAVLSNLANIIG